MAETEKQGHDRQGYQLFFRFFWESLDTEKASNQQIETQYSDFYNKIFHNKIIINPPIRFYKYTYFYISYKSILYFCIYILN